LVFALIAAPAAWLSQTVVGMGIARHACFPKNAPLDYPAFAYADTLLWAVLGVSFAVALCAVIASVWAWRQTRREGHGDGHILLEIGEGRTRFLAMCAMILSTGFSLAICFAAAGINLIPLC
jgi:hypothetical protein